MTRLDLQPTLTGPFITLRPLAAPDFDELFGVASDPLIWAQHPDPARGTRSGFQPFFEEALRSRGCLVAIDTVRDSVIGCSRYTNYEPGERVMIGYTFLARSHWGGAPNAQMKRLMLRHAFTDVPEVLFSIAERNLRSRRAVEKLGAEPAGAEDAPRWGQVHVIYRLTAHLWEQRAALGYGPAPILDAVSLRAATPSERESLEALQRRASLANPADRDSIVAHPDAIEVPLCQLESGQVFIAERGDAIVGFAAIVPRDDGGTEIDALFVEPSLWRQGIGRRLIKHCEAAARSLGSQALCVVGNPHAREFYDASGFVQIGVTATRFGEGILYRMTLD